MDKKGFVLMETIVVIVVISVALLTIFSSYNKILSKVRTENKYDTSEYIYITNYIKKQILKTIQAQDINNNITNILNDTSIASIKNQLTNLYGVKKIYILTNLDNFSGNENKFDAYMIDYIRKLDVRNSDKLIIIEYQREAKDEGTYNPKKDSNGNILYETYIASLEWE